MKKQPHILVVDDDESIRSLLSVMLESEGYRVTEAANAAEALEQAGDQSFDMMTLDLGLPDKDGLDVLKEVKQSHPDLPIVIISVRNDPATRKTAFERGAAYYISKPFESHEVLEAIEEALG